MHPQKRIMAAMNVLGGVAVLGSYVFGFLSHPAASADLWGEVPESIRPFYVANMLLAAAGYLLFTHYLFFRVDPTAASVGGRLDFRVFNLLYLLILLPSALWMPLTFQMLDSPSADLWLAIRMILWTVGLASLALIVALLGLRPRFRARTYWLAIGGSLAFFVQTGLLDALIWVAYFPA